jgi:hypothetical protein
MVAGKQGERTGWGLSLTSQAHLPAATSLPSVSDFCLHCTFLQLGLCGVGLASFTEHRVLKVCQCCSVCLNSYLF